MPDLPRKPEPQPGFPPGRTLHLADIENLMGGPLTGLDRLSAVRAQHERLTPPSHGDHVISACNPRLLVDVSLRWLRSRWLTHHGKDGADQALLEALDADDLAARYSRVVIGSGDHAFTDLAEQLRQRGVEVSVVARPGTLHRALGRAAHVHFLLHVEEVDAALLTTSRGARGCGSVSEFRTTAEGLPGRRLEAPRAPTQGGRQRRAFRWRQQCRLSESHLP